MIHFFITLVIVLMSNYVAYTIGRERGLWNGYFSGRADAFREIERLNEQSHQDEVNN